MIWYGQYNAILILFLIAAIALSFIVGNSAFGILAFILVVVLRVTATFINLIFNAFFGFPFIYDTKIQMVEARAKDDKSEFRAD